MHFFFIPYLPFVRESSRGENRVMVPFYGCKVTTYEYLRITSWKIHETSELLTISQQGILNLEIFTRFRFPKKGDLRKGRGGMPRYTI